MHGGNTSTRQANVKIDILNASYSKTTHYLYEISLISLATKFYLFPRLQFDVAAQKPAR